MHMTYRPPASRSRPTLPTPDNAPRVVALLYVMLLAGMMVSALVIGRIAGRHSRRRTWSRWCRASPILSVSTQRDQPYGNKKPRNHAANRSAPSSTAAFGDGMVPPRR